MTDLFNSRSGSLPSTQKDARAPLPRDPGMRSGATSGKPSNVPTVITPSSGQMRIVSVGGRLQLVHR